MKIIILSIIYFVAVKVAYSTDPAKCQRFIKYNLINACGATKRAPHPFSFHPYSVMDEGEMEQRYRDMVEKGAIMGLDFPDYGYTSADTHHVDSNHIPEENNNVEVNDLLLFGRKKREVLGPIIKPLTQPTKHEKRGSFHFIGHLPSEEIKSPLPGALKAKCCGDYLCSLDDFKGFCG